MLRLVCIYADRHVTMLVRSVVCACREQLYCSKCLTWVDNALGLKSVRLPVNFDM
jgi:hypothetical protein